MLFAKLKSAGLALFASFVVPAGSAGASQIFIDAAGRKVEIPDHVTKVVAAGPPASVLIYVLVPDKLAGWVREPSDAAKEFLLPSTHALPVIGQLTGKAGTANIENIIALKPDLIIDAGSVDPAYASLADRIQQQTHIPYILVDGSFAKTAETLAAVGKLLEVEPRANELSAYAQTVIESAEKAKAAAQKPVRVYYGRGPEGLETGLAGSITTEILESVGAENVAAAAGKGGLTNVSLEQVLSWQPDVILTLDKGSSEKVKSDPAWQGVAAVRAGQVFHAPTLPWGWIDAPPGINRLIGVPWLLSLLQPSGQSTDTRETARAFYKLFYQVPLDDAQLDELLKDASAAH